MFDGIVLFLKTNNSKGPLEGNESRKSFLPQKTIELMFTFIGGFVSLLCGI